MDARRSSRVRKALPPSAQFEHLSQREEKEMRLAIEKSKDEVQAPVSLQPSEALTLYPTVEEFMNPIQFIANNKSTIASNGGIAKIVPPKGWACPFHLETEGLEIPTKLQHVNRLGEGIPYGTGRDFDFASYKEMAETFRDKWLAVLESRGEDPKDPKVWERLYWRIVEGGESEVVVEYGNDVSTEVLGGAFPKNVIEEDADNGSTVTVARTDNPWLDEPDFGNEEYYASTEWNLSNIASSRGSVLGNLRDSINGINVPWLYFGMTFATFSWHVEDNWLYSMNYHHTGQPKLWYGIGPEYQHRFGQVLKQMIPLRFDAEPNLLSDIVTMVSPAWLLNRGMQVHTIVQNQGEFVITLPGAYHGGFSLGFNVGEAVNFAPIDWITPGRLCRDVYRAERRLPVIAHDKIVWGLALQANKLSKDDLSLLANELTILMQQEQNMRDHCTKDGVTFTVLMPKEDPTSDESDIRRTCIRCQQPCSLHAVICQCSPDKASCGLHHQYLCSCPAVKKALVMWNSIDDLRLTVDRLKQERDSRSA
jgi:histone demethylase JARID1